MSTRSNLVELLALAIAVTLLGFFGLALQVRVAELEDTVEMLERDQASLHEGQRELDADAMEALSGCIEALERLEYGP